MDNELCRSSTVPAGSAQSRWDGSSRGCWEGARAVAVVEAGPWPVCVLRCPYQRHRSPTTWGPSWYHDIRNAVERSEGVSWGNPHGLLPKWLSEGIGLATFGRRAPHQLSSCSGWLQDQAADRTAERTIRVFRRIQRCGIVFSGHWCPCSPSTWASCLKGQQSQPCCSWADRRILAGGKRVSMLACMRRWWAAYISTIVTIPDVTNCTVPTILCQSAWSNKSYVANVTHV
jgi:hypothetical protein